VSPAGVPHGKGSDAVGDAVTAFVDDLAPEIEALGATVTGVDLTRLRADVVVDAYNLARAFVDADGLHTDDELWALAATFGPRMGTDIGRATPADMRSGGLLAGARVALQTPSALLDVLATADARDGGDRAQRYARLGAQIGHAVAALDLLPTRAELAAIDAFRGMVQRVIAAHPHVPGAHAAGGPAAAPGTPASGATPTRPEADGVPADGVAAPLAPPRPLEELLDELDGLIGLDEVKREVHLVANLLRVQQIREERGLPVLEQSRHLVFTGNPGTGKTTVARLLAQIYRTLGVVERGHLVETDRAGLVAGYVGQTAGRVVAAFDRADEGVLLIDEAYSLTRGGQNDFGREAIDTVVKLVEDRRDRVVVILAGYPEEMKALVAANPGMRSRFPRAIHFPDYSDDDLVSIVDAIGAGGRYHLDDDARVAARAWFSAHRRDHGFGNGRLARNLFESAVAHQATRLVALADPSDEQLTTITAADVPAPPATAADGTHDAGGTRDLGGQVGPGDAFDTDAPHDMGGAR
jgi:hypothetical protein